MMTSEWFVFVLSAGLSVFSGLSMFSERVVSSAAGWRSGERAPPDEILVINIQTERFFTFPVHKPNLIFT